MASQTPAVPRPAATVILMRRGGKHADRALEVLLVQRSHEASFMPGVWVFPGGVVEEDEREGDGDDADELAHRAAAVRELLEEAGIEIPAEELRPWSRWITPEFVPMRFDTRFYVALAPAHSPPQPDGAETVAADWFEPPSALERHRAGELSLVFPTIKHLEALAPYATSEEALEAAADRDVQPILPKVVREGDGHRVVLPGDPDYEA
jgi:8-oxo-dGTP pyrophosphatase MutT (NUDIX family)